MGSEADLDADIKTLSSLAEHPELYEDFAKLGCAGSLVGLLSHENTDIAIDAVEIISELTDEDVEAEQSQWDALVKPMVRRTLELCRPLIDSPARGRSPGAAGSELRQVSRGKRVGPKWCVPRPEYVGQSERRCR